MPDPTGGLLTAGLTIGGGLLSSGAKSRAANRAATAETQSAQMAIDEQRRQFDQIRTLLQPYVDAGNPALQGLLDLTGLGSQGGQAAAIQQQEQNPLFQALAQQGENALLQNASATGGLRGGNIEGALGQFRPQLLNQFIEQQYGRLGGLASIGQNAAVGVGNAGMNAANQIGRQFNTIGSAQAGGAIGRGAAQAGMFSGMAGPLGTLLGPGGAFGASGLFG